MLDWLIIGGGIQGTTIALALTRRYKVPRDRLHILDPHDEPLVLWTHNALNTGMQFLRSPLVHHLNDDPWSLRTFAETRQGKPFAHFIPLYERPSFDLFQAYSHWLIDRYDIAGLRIKGRANNLTRLESGWRVETENGAIESRNVLIAVGITEQLHYPDWAIALQVQNTPLHHLFERDFVRADLPEWSHVVMIGGGISAAQTALTMAKQQPQRQPGSVTLLMRHEMRVHHFDSDPCWVTRLCLEDFHREPDPNRRRAMITSARHRGSIPPDVAQELNDAVDEGILNLQTGEVIEATFDGQNINLVIRTPNTNSQQLKSDCVILATGFDTKRPGGDWLDTAVAEYDLSIADCGYPIVDQTLCWADGLYVTGPLAQLEIGPVAGNIIGARLAAERLRHAR